MMESILSPKGYKSAVVKNATIEPVGKNRSALSVIDFLNEHIDEYIASFEGFERNRFASASLDESRYNILSKHHRDISVIKHPSRTQVEKNIARLMRRSSRDELVSFGEIGQVLNFEVPLNVSTKDFEKRNDQLGEIDLVSYNGRSEKLYLLELKRPDSSESLLRCVLEIFTYAMAIKDFPAFVADFGAPSNSTIVLAPLFYGSNMSSPYVDYCKLKRSSAFLNLISSLETALRERVPNALFEFVVLQDSPEMQAIRKASFDNSLWV